MTFLENTRKPDGFGGKLMVSMMNLGHRALADWGFRFLCVPADAAVLDCGCGGGANVERLLKMCPDGSVQGIDYAAVSVEKSRALNRRAIEDGRCGILCASVTALPFGEARFDLVTAFETVYFWPGLVQSFREVCRVLKPGGTFFICNECSGDTAKDEKWTRKISGMTIYRDVELQAALEQAGFCETRIYKNAKGWLCVMAQKEN